MKILFRAANVIQRDALIYRLRVDGIEPNANMSNVVVQYGNEPNIAWEGLSSLYEGYAILVDESQYDKAKAILDEFLAVDKFSVAVPTNYFSLFLKNAFFSMMMGFTAPFAAYFLFRAIHNKEKLTAFKLVLGLLCMTGGFFLLYFGASSFLAKLIE